MEYVWVWVDLVWLMPALMPHGSCFLWDPWLTGLHVVSDGAVVIAYLSIPVMLYLGRHRATPQVQPVLLMFAAFILSCGIGHLLRIWNIWHANYWLEGSWSALTGAVSLLTAWHLRHLIHDFLGLHHTLAATQALVEQDPLTGIANRRGLATALQRLRDSDAPGAINTDHMLLVIDLDGFKQVNDTCGHQTGDHLLQEVAQVLTHAVRIDDVPARLGGDEFAMILTHCAVAEGEAIAARILAAIRTLKVNCGRLTCDQPSPDPMMGASIGLTQLSAQEPLEVAVHRADLALYQAKAQGKNRVIITPCPYPALSSSRTRLGHGDSGQ